MGNRKPTRKQSAKKTNRRAAAKPHRFGRFKVRGCRVVGWKLPANCDDDCMWGSDE